MILLRPSLILFLTASIGTAAPPEVKTLFPAGGQRSQTVEVTVGGKLNARPVSVWASRPGVSVEVPDEGEKVKVTIADDAATGVHWLRFHNAEGAATLRPFVVGTLPEAAEAEPNNEYHEPQEIPGSSAVINGRLEKSGDIDVFAVPLSAGQTLVAVLDANRTLGSPMDGVLQVVSSRGFVLAQNDDAPGLDPLLEFTAVHDGTYIVRLFAFPAEPDSSIRLAGGGDFLYRLTVTTGPLVDHVVPLAVTRGSAATLELTGWNLGDEQRSLDVGTEDAEIVVPFPVSRAATARIRRVPCATAVEEERDSGGGAQRLELPVAVTGRIDAPGDGDVYAFTGKKGEKRVFRIEGRSLGSPLDPVLELTDAAGKSLRRVDDARRGSFDGELEFTFEADGEYRLEVTDLYGHGGLRYVYLLTAAPPQPDYALSVKDDVFQLKAGQPLEIPVSVERANGFEGEVEITLAGAPESIRAEPVKSLAKGDTAKSVKVKLQADEGTAFRGPIRIVGRVAGQPDLERAAAAPIAGLSSTTAELWLTVVGEPAPKQP